MRPYQLAVLSVGCVPVLAWESKTSFLSDLGACKAPSPKAQLLENSECLNVGVWGLNESGNLAASSWSYSTPCVLNGTKEYCVYTNTQFANGRGITLMTRPEFAARIAELPVFTDPSVLDSVNNLNADESTKWKVVPVPGKGMGVVATRRLEIGDHIMSTTPSIMIDYNAVYDVPESRLRRMQVDGISYLPARHRAKFLNLTTHDFAQDHETTVNKIIVINSFDIENTGMAGPKSDDVDGDSWYTVFPEISRLNHDCRPNADYYFDPETMTQHVHVVRPIAAGEEITISYIEPVMTREKRHKRISSAWHFDCDCSTCTQNAELIAAAYERIGQIEDIRKHMRDYTPESAATPQMGELLVSLYEQDHLWNMLYEAYTYAAIEYNGAGEPWLATKYARLAIQHGLATGGPRDLDVIEMKALAKDPWKHWSWMLRTRKRMSWGQRVDE